jgi:hypothetical protein
VPAAGLDRQGVDGPLVTEVACPAVDHAAILVAGMAVMTVVAVPRVGVAVPGRAIVPRALLFAAVLFALAAVTVMVHRLLVG